MQATGRPEFTPPPEPGLLRSVGLALLAHALLVGALSWGLKWKRDDQDATVEAELWSATAQQAAPREAPAPPPPPPPPVPAPTPAPAPPAPTPAPAAREADIALERERKQAEERKARQEAERRKQEQAKKAAEEQRREEQAKARARQQEEQKLAQLREENLRRMQGLAGATGPRESTGSATRSSGPSDSYAGRIRARVKPNIVFTDDVPGNPRTVVEVRLAPDGTIVGKRILTPSGIPSWDDAVLRALDRTQVLPRDVDGRVISPLELVFRPKD